MMALTRLHHHALLLTLIVVPIVFFANGVVAAATTPRTVFVHLFEWKWTDIAQECENFLGPKGYSAVQVSPPNEHVVLANNPWYERYQPVTYQLTSRSGNRAQFIDMVHRCKAAGVDIYVDAVINHMAGVDSGNGIAGSHFTHYNYPGVYSSQDFHHCGRSGNDDIADYTNRFEVQNCELLNLADLNTESSYVRDKIAAYMNDAISIGVAGFRIDAAKHIAADDLAAIIKSRLTGSPYIYQEVAEATAEPIHASEYYATGDVTEFKYSAEISRVFLTGKLSWLQNFGAAWGFMPTDSAIVFTDNHDKQRSGGVITYKNGNLYDLANVFALAWPYGYPQIMSSFDFDLANTDKGPPSDANGNTNSIYINGEPEGCFAAWKCEHRRRPVANMVAFRNIADSSFYISDWWTDGNNQIGFGRGIKGYVVINREGQTLQRSFQTSMPAGTYCNVIASDYTNGSCDSTVIVDRNGMFTASVPAYTALAVHAGALVSAATAATRN